MISDHKETAQSARIKHAQVCNRQIVACLFFVDSSVVELCHSLSTCKMFSIKRE
jgi:hypothetical protein